MSVYKITDNKIWEFDNNGTTFDSNVTFNGGTSSGGTGTTTFNNPVVFTNTVTTTGNVSQNPPGMITLSTLTVNGHMGLVNLDLPPNAYNTPAGQTDKISNDLLLKSNTGPGFNVTSGKFKDILQNTKSIFAHPVQVVVPGPAVQLPIIALAPFEGPDEGIALLNPTVVTFNAGMYRMDVPINLAGPVGLASNLRVDLEVGPIGGAGPWQVVASMQIGEGLSCGQLTGVFARANPGNFRISCTATTLPSTIIAAGGAVDWIVKVY